MNEEKIYKLIDKEGYLGNYFRNRQILDKYGILVQGDVYYKCVLGEYGFLQDINLEEVLIDQYMGELKYFEEIDSLSSKDESTPVQQPLSERVYQFAKEHKLYSSYDGEKDYFIVLILDIDYKVSTIEDLDKIEQMYKLHKELRIQEETS